MPLAAPFTAIVSEDVLPGGTEAGDGSATSGEGNSTLDLLVNFGADGPNPTPFQFVANAAAALTNLGILSSHGASVDFKADITTTAGVGTTLAAYTGGSTSGTEVFTLTLNDDGAWAFTLLAPIDHNGLETLDFSSLVQGVDFDGDGVTLPANAIAVTVLDDAPFAHFVSATIAEDAGPTTIATLGTDFGYGADGPATTGAFTFNSFLIQESGPNEFFGSPTLQVVDGSLQITPGTAFQEARRRRKTATFEIGYSATDFDGSSASADITLTVTGVNEAPVLGGGVISGTIDEQTSVTGATTPDFATGSFSFTDVDFNDKHTVTVSFSPADAVWSGASENNLSIPQQTLTDLATAFTAAATHDSFFEGQTGTVTWTASLPDQDLDFLAEGETLTS